MKEKPDADPYMIQTFLLLKSVWEAFRKNPYNRETGECLFCGNVGDANHDLYCTWVRICTHLGKPLREDVTSEGGTIEVYTAGQTFRMQVIRD